MTDRKLVRAVAQCTKIRMKGAAPTQGFSRPAGPAMIHAAHALPAVLAATLALAAQAGVAHAVTPFLSTAKDAAALATCQQAQVNLHVTGSGDPQTQRLGLDVMIVFDRSGSMSQQGVGSPNTKLVDAKNAANTLIGQLDSSKDRVGLVSFSDTGTLNSALTSSFSTVTSAINGLTANGNTNIGDGVYVGQNEIATHGRAAPVVKVMVVLTDGIANRQHPSPQNPGNSICPQTPTVANICTQDAINEAAAAKATGTIVYTIGLQLGTDASGLLSASILQSMATDPGKFFNSPSSTQLQGIFQSIATQLLTLAGSNVVVTDLLPSGVTYITGSASPAPTSVSGQTLTWNLGIISIGSTMNITFNVTISPSASGFPNALVDDPTSGVSYTDFQGNPASTLFPVTHVNVTVCPVCGNGIPESGEQCDQGAANGTLASCCTVTCTLKASGTTCTDDGNICTLDQCNGTSDTCQHPAGNAGVVCRAGSGDQCDPDEVCTGSSPTCPSDSVQPNTFTCRPAAGECDLDDKCPGVAGQPCPADAKKPNGTGCADDGNACTTDTCNGTSNNCQHPAGNAGVVCRTGSGDQCDPDELCTGSSPNCPSDVVKSNTFVCRAAAGDCDAAEKCPGVAGQGCPGDGKKASGSVCPDDGNVCTTDTCDGSSNACQHTAGNAGMVCRAGSGDQCDPDEKCTGSSPTCPADVVQPNTSTCRTAAGECDLDDKCPGVAGQPCTADAKKPNGTGCADDGNPCTTDTCNGTSNSCQHPAGNGGTVCRAGSGDVCDPDELCTGTSTTCPADVKKSASFVCRAAVDVCDKDEKCTGVAGQPCPPGDSKQSAGTACTSDGNPCTLDQCDGTSDACQHPAGNSGAVCRTGSGDMCDPTETCDGSSPTCPPDVVQPSTVVCRATAGECDQAETCPGVAGQKCSAADTKKPSGTLCTDDGNVCTTDTCNGSSNSCQHHAGNAGTVCRAGSGDLCDPDETCTGTSATCPADAVQPPTFVCRAAAGECDLDETCPGAAGQPCPSDAKKASGTTCTADSNPCTLDQCDGSTPACQHPAGNAGAVCRTAAGPCDVAESCTGTSATCPTDGLAPSGRVCRPAAGACDVSESCTGSNPQCPTDAFKPSGTLCRGASTSCDPPENCTGSSASCPTDVNPDVDCDGVLNDGDNCLFLSNPDQKDTDHDGVGDACDNCPDVFNPAQSDVDHNGKGDLCDGSSEAFVLNGKPKHVCMGPNSAADPNGNGKVIVRGTLDFSVLPMGLVNAALNGGFMVGVTGGGLPQIETMQFEGTHCLPLGKRAVRCIGDDVEQAIFRQKGKTSLYAVTILANNRSFPAPLDTDPVTVTISAGGRDMQFTIGTCIMQGVALKCRQH